ncbi:MAG: hypothetical protein ACOZAJ_01355 [Patescibacteria group bacterium]
MKLPELFTKPLKVRLKSDNILPWLPMVTLIVLGFLFIGLIVFLYQNFYQTLAQVKEVNLLRSQVTQYRINVPLYEKVWLNWQRKSKADLQKLNDQIINPFSLDRSAADKNETTETDKTPTANDQASSSGIKPLP